LNLSDLAQSPDNARLAASSLQFDICADGTVVYSNGQGVFFLDANGSAALEMTGELVAQVVAAPA
jgi:hypothetical protein